MTTDTEALRAAFEDYINPEGDVALHWQPAGYYAGGGLQGRWLDFQSGYRAGHAAAKAETAAAVAKERERATDVLASFIPEWDGQEAVDGGDLIRMLIDAIRAGVKEPDGDPTL